MYIRRESPTPLSDTIPHAFISRARDTEVFSASPGGAELWCVESTVTNLTVFYLPFRGCGKLQRSASCNSKPSPPYRTPTCPPTAECPSFSFLDP